MYRDLTIARIAVVYALCAAVITGAWAVDYEAIWRPQTPDAKTVDLYHLDEADPDAAVAEVDMDIPEPSIDGGGGLLEAMGGDPIDIATPDGPPKAASAVPLRPALPVYGAATFVPGGRFGGGLRLPDGKSGISGEFGVKNPHDNPARTVAFWFRPDALPETRCTVFSYRNVTPIPHIKQWNGEVTISLTAAGDLELDMDGKVRQTAPGVVRAGEWCHVAIGWGNDRGGRIYLWHVNGSLKAKGDVRVVRDLWQTDTWSIGTGSLRQNGMVGMIDEVYVSRSMRGFYEIDLDWVDRDGTLARAVAPPYFRSSDDQLLHVDFNRRLAPVVAPPGTTAPSMPTQVGTVGELDIISDAEADDAMARWFPGGTEKTGLRVMPDGPAAVYSGRDLAGARGTVAFWFRPLNWDNYTRRNPLSDKPQKISRILTIDQAGERKINVVLNVEVNNTVQNPFPLHPGKWTHVAICWEGDHVWSYINGERLNPWGTWSLWFKPLATGVETTITMHASEHESIVDDLRVFRIPLAESEIRNLSRLHHRFDAPTPLPPFDATIHWNGVTGVVGASVVPLMPELARLRTAELTLLAADTGAEIATISKPFADEGEAFAIELTTDPLAWGRYSIRVRGLDAADASLGEVTHDFERTQPPWWQNDIGISDTAPPDWSAMQVDGREVTVDRRVIRFGAGGLPEQITADGEPILAGPIQVDAPTALAPIGDFAVRSANEVLVQTRGLLQGPGYTVQIDCDAEFDGYMWYTVTLTPAADTAPRIDRLSLRIPYRSENADLYHWWSGAAGFRNSQIVRIGAFPAGDGVLFRSDQDDVAHTPGQTGNFIPYILLSGNHRGLAWFAENDRGWTPGDTHPALVVERTGDRTDLLLHMISTPIALDGPRVIQFGLQPIPVKHETPGWRATPWWGVTPDSFSGNDLKGNKSAMFNRHPTDMDWDAVQGRLTGHDTTSSQPAALYHITKRFEVNFERDYGRPPVAHERLVPALYHDLRRFGTFPEMCREWQHIWKGKTDAKIYNDELVDYLTWIWNEWIERTFVEGVYMDDAFNVPVYDYPSPVTYLLPDGSVQPGFQWRGHRAAIKRMRQVLWDHGKRPYMCVHTTHTNFVPYHSFFDVVLDGEDRYASPGREADFLDLWSLDRMRFINGSKWGQTTTWLGWCADGDWPREPAPQWVYRQQRAFDTALLLADMIWARHDYQQRCFRRTWLRDAKWEIDPDVQAHPYWDDGGIARHEHADIRVTAWTREGRCLVAIGNVGTANLTAEVTLDPRAMGFGDTPLAELVCTDVDPGLIPRFDSHETPEETPDVDPDMIDGDALDLALDEPETPAEERAADPAAAYRVEDGKLILPVRPHDYRLIEFTRPE